uniref:Uncharacterized protein n=1 Tax=Archaeoglobus fulgidus TaxID=2234 RepID=A0A7C3RB25_ARCFL
MEAIEEEDTNLKLADKILENLMKIYSIEEIMQTVKKYKDKSIYLCVKRSKPESPKIFVDSNGNHCYRCDETLMIPIPKKFAVLEPDRLYFEMTLRANIMLALNGAKECDLHR